MSVAGGLRDRKRPFSLLRLTGTQLGVLRRVVLLESAVPLLVVAVVAIGMGFLAAQLFVQAQFDYSIRAPGIQYYAIVLTGLVASLGASPPRCRCSDGSRAPKRHATSRGRAKPVAGCRPMCPSTHKGRGRSGGRREQQVRPSLLHRPRDRRPRYARSSGI